MALDIQPTASVDVPGGVSPVRVGLAAVSMGTNKAPGSIARARSAAGQWFEPWEPAASAS